MPKSPHVIIESSPDVLLHECVPESSLIKDGNNFQVKVGELPIDPEYLLEDTKIRLEFTVKRSTQQHSMDFYYVKVGRI